VLFLTENTPKPVWLCPDPLGA